LFLNSALLIVACTSQVQAVGLSNGWLKDS
jgi:hypothetical protein